MVERARGFGMAAASPTELFAEVASEAERAGYQTFWVNDTPGADGLERLKLAMEATSTLRLGVGVIPVDRRGPDHILATLEELDLPEDRLIVGIGAGQTRVGSLAMVEQSIAALREGSSARIAVGALGPNMVKLSARFADAVLLNWLTAGYVQSSKAWMQNANPGASTEVIGYVRVGGPGAEEQVAAEADRYASIPQYGRHFESMGVRAIDTCAIGSSKDIAAKLGEFDAVLDETVVRAVAANETLEDYQEILRRGMS